MIGEPASRNPLDDDPNDPPLPSEVRRVILTDHKHIRELLNALQVAATAASERPGRETWNALREHGITLLGRMLSHIDLENRILAPALRDTDSYGPVRAHQLIADHAQQRGALEADLMLLNGPDSCSRGVPERMLKLVEFIREDMRHEERDLLDEELLRDDIISISPVG